MGRPEPPLSWVQATQATPASVQWFAEMRVMNTNKGFMVKSFQSQKTTTKATLDVKCTPYSCSACSSTTVRLYCHAVQEVSTLIAREHELKSVVVPALRYRYAAAAADSNDLVALQFQSELGKKQAAEQLLLQEKASLSLLQSAADDKARAHWQMHCSQ